MRTRRILVSLDCLMDTLLGTVELLNPEWAEQLLSTPRYHTRKSDRLSLILPDISDTQVERRYVNRDMEVLRKSRATVLLGLLADDIQETSNYDEDHPDFVDTRITVNTHPYDLSPNELTELFTTLKQVLGVPEILHVHMPTSNVTPDLLNGSYDKFIIRDMHLWCEANIGALGRTPIKHITCVMPLLIHKLRSYDQIPDESIEKAIPLGFVAHLDIQVLDLLEYSIDLGETQ